MTDTNSMRGVREPISIEMTPYDGAGLSGPQLDDAAVARVREAAVDVLARYPRPRSAVMPLLYLVQAEQGFVSPSGVRLVAEILELTTAQVAAVATFYTMYKREPCGAFNVGVCTNTLCAVMGGDAIYAALADHLGIEAGQTTDDGKVTLERIECNAACDYAPVLMVNWEYFDNQTVESARELVDALRQADPADADSLPRPTRGARLHDFKSTSRMLAGFPDDRVGEGPSAGPASLAGVELARQRDERAPDLPDHGHGEGQS